MCYDSQLKTATLACRPCYVLGGDFRFSVMKTSYFLCSRLHLMFMFSICQTFFREHYSTLFIKHCVVLSLVMETIKFIFIVMC